MNEKFDLVKKSFNEKVFQYEELYTQYSKIWNKNKCLKLKIEQLQKASEYQIVNKQLSQSEAEIITERDSIIFDDFMEIDNEV